MSLKVELQKAELERIAHQIVKQDQMIAERIAIRRKLCKRLKKLEKELIEDEGN